MEQRRFFAPDGTNMMLSWNQDKVPQSLRKSFSPTGGDYLPVDFVPGRFDVICARGKEALNHPGNLRYRHLIELYLGQYDSAPTKVQKSKIVSAIVEAVRRSSPTGGFVRFDGSRRRWYEVGDHVAREKTGQVYVLYCRRL